MTTAPSYLAFEQKHLSKVLYEAKTRLDHLPRADRRVRQHDLHRVIVRMFADIRTNWPDFQDRQAEVITQIYEALGLPI